MTEPRGLDGARSRAVDPAPATNAVQAVTGLRVTVATAGQVPTARNPIARNDTAVGLSGWVLQAQDANPLPAEVPIGGHRVAIVAITDGLPGIADGDEAARIAAHRLTRRKVSTHPEGPGSVDWSSRLFDAFVDADSEIHGAKADPASGMGCTAAVLLADADGQALIGNVGDVRVYRIVDGYLGQASADELADIDAASRCLGGLYREPVAPQLYHVRLRPRDRILLCNRGMHRHLADAQLLQQSVIGNPQDVARNLVRAAMDASPDDSITVAVVDVLGPPPPPLRPMPAGRSTTSGPSVSVKSVPPVKTSRWKRVFRG